MRTDGRSIKCRIYALVALMVGAMVWVIHRLSGLPYWVCTALAIFGLFVNGLIAMVVDE